MTPITHHYSVRPFSTPVKAPRELWRIFSPPVIRSLLTQTGAAVVRKLLSDIGYAPPRSQRCRPSLATVYNDAFAALTENGATEYAYKNAVVQRVLFSKQSRPGSRVYFEFRTGASKLDALVINESLHAIEIKSELDHLNRLSAQLAAYKSRFAHVWVFGSEKNIGALTRAVESEVGLICLRSNRRFSIERDATADWSRLSPTAMLEMLRQPEYLRVLSRFGFSPEGIPNTRVFTAAMHFAKSIDPAALHDLLPSVLVPRAATISARALRRVPYSLRGGAVPLLNSASEIDFLVENLRSTA